MEPPCVSFALRWQSTLPARASVKQPLFLFLPLSLDHCNTLLPLWPQSIQQEKIKLATASQGKALNILSHRLVLYSLRYPELPFLFSAFHFFSFFPQNKRSYRQAFLHVLPLFFIVFDHYKPNSYPEKSFGFTWSFFFST